MSKTRLNSWKDCTDSKNVTSFAQEHGLEIRECAGSHKMMKTSDGKNSMTYYNGDISTGVACKIFKWFKTMGILGILLLGFWLFSRPDCGPSNYTSVTQQMSGEITYSCE